MSVVIQRAIQADIEALVALEDQMFEIYDGKLNRRTFRYHSDNKNLLLVAKSSQKTDQVMGYILVLVHRLSARIYSIATHPECHRQGIARSLVQNVISTLAAKDIGRISLELRQGNSRALALYTSLGFKKRGVYPSYYGDGEDALRMQLNYSVV